MACSRMTYDLWHRLITAYLRDMNHARGCLAYWLHMRKTGMSLLLPSTVEGFIVYHRSRWVYHMEELRRLPFLSDCQ